jgi:hypothetical protein
MARADLSDPEIKEAFDDIKNPNSSTTWYFKLQYSCIKCSRIMLGYVPKSDTKLKLVDKGEGGLKGISDLWNDGKILYALVAFEINKTKKFCYIPWCGEGVTGMKKGLFNTHSQDVGFFFKVQQFNSF